MQSVLTYHDAQMDYASVDHDGDGALEYAQKIFSTPGKHDGLYWADDDSGQLSPLGPLFGNAIADEDWHGYHFASSRDKVLGTGWRLQLPHR